MDIPGLGVAYFVRHPYSHIGVFSHPLSLAVHHALHRGSLMGHGLVHDNELHGDPTRLPRGVRVSAYSHYTLAQLTQPTEIS